MTNTEITRGPPLDRAGPFEHICSGVLLCEYPMTVGGEPSVGGAEESLRKIINALHEEEKQQQNG